MRDERKHWRNAVGIAWSVVSSQPTLWDRFRCWMGRHDWHHYTALSKQSRICRRCKLRQTLETQIISTDEWSDD